MDMKKIFQFLCMASALIAWSACEREGQQQEEEPVVESEYYEFPIKYAENHFEASDNGVSIEVTSIKEDNVVFELVPEASVGSYRLLVYPKALLYNYLLNEGCVDEPADACEDALIKLMTDGSAASYVFSDHMDDYDCKEFDWVNTEYATAMLVPDCEYYIIVLGCYDKDASNPASLSICSFTTAAQPIVGNPAIEIEAEVGFRAFIVRYNPNEDCKQFVHWIWTTDEMGGYIDLFGDRLMRDFCRTIAVNLDAADEANLAIKRTFDVTENVVRENTAVAVAMDANGTPSSVIARKDFTLMEVPEGEFEPVAHISAGNRISATLAYLDVTMEKTCISCFFRLYTADEIEQLKAMSEDDKEDLARNIAMEGWGVKNNNFGFNKELGILTGDSSTTHDERVVELQPETTYALAYVARNYFGELSELCFSEPFTTKALVRDNPDACEAEVTMTFTDITRWGFNYNFDYNYDKTACYRFQMVWPYIEDNPDTDEDDDMVRPPHYINDANDRDKWMEFFFDTFVESPAVGPVPVVNMWEAEPYGHDELAMYGYESGVTYVFAYCAEDINGVVGPVKFVHVTTTEPNPGPDPKVAFEELRYDDETGAIVGVIKANEDAKSFKYFAVTSSTADLYSNCALNDLVNTSRRDYATYVASWERNLMEYGLQSYSESVTISATTEKNSSLPVLIAAIAVGEENGEDVYSPLASKIYYNGEFMDLSDFRTPPAE